MTPARLSEIEARHAAAAEDGRPMATTADVVSRQDISDLLALAKEQAAENKRLRAEVDSLLEEADECEDGGP